jgi:hypothetical protein
MPETGNNHLYRLSVQAGLNDCSFIVINDAAATCLSLHRFLYQSVSDDNERQKDLEGWLHKLRSKNAYHTVSQCCICLPSFTLVPSTVFHPETAAQLLKAVHPLGDLDEVYHFHLDSPELVCVYSIPQYLSQSLIKHYKHTQFYSIAIPILQRIIRLEGHTRALFFYWDQHLYLALARADQLLLCNAYKAPQFETALYFLFAALHQWQLNPMSLRLHISGQLQNIHLNLLCRYFPHILSLSDPEIALENDSLNLQHSLILHPLCASSEAY